MYIDIAQGKVEYLFYYVHVHVGQVYFTTVLTYLNIKASYLTLRQ